MTPQRRGEEKGRERERRGKEREREGRGKFTALSSYKLETAVVYIGRSERLARRSRQRITIGHR